MLIGTWVFSVKPEVQEVVVSRRAGMFYTHRKLQHKQLEWQYYCKKNHRVGKVTALNERLVFGFALWTSLCSICSIHFLIDASCRIFSGGIAVCLCIDMLHAVLDDAERLQYKRMYCARMGEFSNRQNTKPTQPSSDGPTHHWGWQHGAVHASLQARLDPASQALLASQQRPHARSFPTIPYNIGTQYPTHLFRILILRRLRNLEGMRHFFTLQKLEPKNPAVPRPHLNLGRKNPTVPSKLW